MCFIRRAVVDNNGKPQFKNKFYDSNVINDNESHHLKLMHIIFRFNHYHRVHCRSVYADETDTIYLNHSTFTLAHKPYVNLHGDAAAPRTNNYILNVPI